MARLAKRLGRAAELAVMKPLETESSLIILCSASDRTLAEFLVGEASEA